MSVLKWVAVSHKGPFTVLEASLLVVFLDMSLSSLICIGPALEQGLEPKLFSR